MKNLIYNVLNYMSEYLNISQMKLLQEVFIISLAEKKEDECEQTDSLDDVRLFLSAKNIEGCTDRTINYYQSTLFNLYEDIKLPIRMISMCSAAC